MFDRSEECAESLFGRLPCDVLWAPRVGALLLLAVPLLPLVCLPDSMQLGTPLHLWSCDFLSRYVRSSVCWAAVVIC